MLFIKSKKQQKGQGMAEYLIMVGVIAVGALGVFGLLGETIENNVAGMTEELVGGDATGTSLATAQTASDNAVTAATQEAQRTLGNYADQSQFE